MAAKEITIMLEDDQLLEIQELVAAGAAPDTAAFVRHAVGIALSDAAGWREMMREALEATGGPLTDPERMWADGILSPGDSGGSGTGKAA